MDVCNQRQSSNQDCETGEIYCLVHPEERVSPSWEKVDVFGMADRPSQLQ